MSDKLTPSQLRGARAMLSWSILKLSTEAGVSVSTIKRLEMSATQSVSEDLRSKISNALERAGVIFLPDDGEGEGLRLRQIDDAGAR